MLWTDIRVAVRWPALMQTERPLGEWLVGLLENAARVCPRLVFALRQAQLRVRFDTDAVKLRFRPESPQWPKLVGVAAASSLATLFVARNFFPAEKKVRHPIRANYSIGDEVFVRTMGHLLGIS